jgi:hypothetical protein
MGLTSIPVEPSAQVVAKRLFQLQPANAVTKAVFAAGVG